MKKHIVITIDREYGSGGREIGKKLAEELNMRFLDEELLEILAQETGLDQKVLHSKDEKTGNLYYYLQALNMALGSPVSGVNEMSLNDKLYLLQAQIMERIASEETCVIVGRSADFILKDVENIELVKVFIVGEMNDKMKRVKEEYQDKAKDYEAHLLKIDRTRANYYNYHTGKKWGRSDNYDVCLNSSKIGIDGCVASVKSCLKNKKK